MENIVTEKIEEFGLREIWLLKDLLIAWVKQGLPEDFNGEKVRPALNKNSGYVFLTNEEYQVAMLNGNTLESGYSCPICGYEGFKKDMKHNEDNEECQEYLQTINIS